MRYLPLSILLAAGAALLAGQSPALAAAQPVKKPAAKNVVKWLQLDPGLADAKSRSKPAVLVFMAGNYKGPAIFDDDAPFKALTDSGATPVKVLQPGTLTIPKTATAEKAKKLRDDHDAALKKYQELAAKYGVTAVPTMVFLSPEGDFIWKLANPTEQQVNEVMAGLPKLVGQFMAAKAKAQPQPQPPAGDKPKPEDQPKDAPPAAK